MALRSRRRQGGAEHADEGPFVSFTDLFIGILFLFLILVAALMLMHQEAMRKQREEIQRLTERIRQLEEELKLAKVQADRPAFRLGIVFNIYQRQAVANAPWTFARSVQIFRATNGLCITNVLLRSNLSTAWRPPAPEEAIPTVADQKYISASDKCALTASGDRWDTESETGELKRVSPSLYAGTATLHKQGGDVKLEMQYRVLGVYDDYFRSR